MLDSQQLRQQRGREYLRQCIRIAVLSELKTYTQYLLTYVIFINN